MNFQFAWLVVLVLSVLGGAFASCPAGYTADKSKCVSERPIHGTCNPGSTYKANINKCVLD